MTITMLLFFSFFAAPKQEVPKSIYDFKVAGLEGGTIDFSQFRGKKILIVNTASYCSHTHQYADLQKLSDRYRDHLVVVGFPANNFFFEEPGSNEKIATFCKTRYNVGFPMAAKISVKGHSMAPIYQWLTEKQYNGFADSKVKWNFQKYVINEKGELTHIFDPTTPPDAPEIIKAIEE